MVSTMIKVSKLVINDYRSLLDVEVTHTFKKPKAHLQLSTLIILDDVQDQSDERATAGEQRPGIDVARQVKVQVGSPRLYVSQM